MTPESRNSGARARRPLMSNDEVKIKFPLQLLTKTRLRGNEYADTGQGVARRLSHVFMATENNRTISCSTWRSLFGPHEVSLVRDSEIQIENSRDYRPVRGSEIQMENSRD
jgi:hypothetical protein